MDTDGADAPSAAALTERGRELEVRGELAQAWECWRTAAFDGHEPAMRNLSRSLRGEHTDEAQLWRWHAVVAARTRAAGPPPPDVAVAAAGLGTPLLAFGHGDGSPAEASLGCGLLVALALGAAGVVGTLGGAAVVGVGCLVVAAAAIVLLLVLWTRSRGRRHVGAWEFEKGLVHRDEAGRLVTLPWAAVQGVPTSDGCRVEHGGGTVELPNAAFPPGQGAVLARIVAHRAPG